MAITKHRLLEALAARRTVAVSCDPPSPSASSHAMAYAPAISISERPDDDLPNQQEQPFRFLDLPPELRSMVYDYLIPTSATTFSDTATATEWLLISSGPSSSTWKPTPLPSICQTNKHLRNETLPIYFSRNFLRLSVTSVAALPVILRFLDTGFDVAKASIVRRMDISIGSAVTAAFGSFHGVRIFPDSRNDVGEVLARQGAVKMGIEAVIKSSKRAAATADLGIRGHHIARILRVVFEDSEGVSEEVKSEIHRLCVVRRG